MDEPKQTRPQRSVEPAAPATPDGTVPYTDPLPTAEGDVAAPDEAPRSTRPRRDSEPDDRRTT